MSNSIRFVVLAIVGMLNICHAEAAEQYCADTGPRTLRVVFYPFIPNVDNAILNVKQSFEDGCPGLDLQIIRLDDNYYSSEKHQGILYTQADVYEVDSVFMSDFLQMNKAQPFSQAVIDSVGQTVLIARPVGKRGLETFAIPHWLCTDFLIYRKDQLDIAGIKSFSDLKRVFSSGANADKLIVDLNGASTLGEIYLSTIVALYGLDHFLDHLTPVDEVALKNINDILALDPPGFGRNRDYHGRDGFYQKQFSRGSGTAVLGYSETTDYVLTEGQQSCKQGECLTEDKLAVLPFPFGDSGTKPVAWVDSYMIDAAATGATLRDAEAFVSFMMRRSTYRQLVIPTDGQPPRYLLPARDDVYSDPEVIKHAPLYASFKPIVDGATPVTADHLNDTLRNLGGVIDAKLAANH